MFSFALLAAELYSEGLVPHVEDRGVTATITGDSHGRARVHRIGVV